MASKRWVSGEGRGPSQGPRTGFLFTVTLPSPGKPVIHSLSPGAHPNGHCYYEHLPGSLAGSQWGWNLLHYSEGVSDFQKV